MGCRHMKINAETLKLHDSINCDVELSSDFDWIKAVAKNEEEIQCQTWKY